ncbi:MAG: alanine racemase [Clostridiales bacterium]|nr:alanine racemase [Clostridiales bacterium]
MMLMLRQNRTIVDLGAIRHNYRILAEAVPEGVRVVPVVKADAYGHGMVEVAKAVLAEGAAFFAVALVEEGILLRENGIAAEILVLGAAMEKALEAAVANDLIQTVFDPQTVFLLEEVARTLGKTAAVHIKLDTGMGRIGLRTHEEAHALREALAVCPHVKATGIYTHFADADNPPGMGGMNRYSKKQLSRFLELKSCFDPGLIAHAANSAMSLLAPEACFQMVREGISLYGYPPVQTRLSFRHALRWESEVVHVKEVAPGDSIGYGCTFTAPATMRIATVAVGYGDGYHRFASNRAQMLVHGRRAPVVGWVCMDQTMIDVSETPDVQVGDPVVLLGTQGDETIDAEELAAWAGTISYEVLLAITRRVPREFVGAAEDCSL